MKKRRLLQFLVLLGVVCCALPALAGTATMNQDHALTLTFSGSSIGDVSGSLSSYVSALGATFNDGSGSNTFPDYPAAALASTNVFTTTTGTASANSATTFGLTQAMSVISPVLDNPSTYFFTLISLSFQADATGIISVDIADTYARQYGLAGNGSGGFQAVSWDSTLYAQLGGSSASDPGASTYNFQLIIADSRDSTPFFAPNFNVSDALLLGTLGTLSISALEGDTITLDISLESSFSGQVGAVPVPPSVLLLGSGLGGLFFLRRRFGRA